ncbi:unnamed protein product [Thlaspi arvense]|uniref:Uncharacterized protein n=1 Tax=Thlaspi arvense TaxID=13288 RepID=A0AAU9RSX5_THLAR|nr:unnamed protein product [Thlaspi arvense]
MVSGWVRQLAMLSRPAMGGLVSHCGWNSVLESIGYGVPIPTWPIYAEQQENPFQLVRKLVLAVKITLDCDQQSCSAGGARMVSAAEIERGMNKEVDGGRM